MKDECKEEEVKKETCEDVSEQPKVEQVTDEEESDDDEAVMETTPQMEGASVIKYSVKTTPYLQRSVRQSSSLWIKQQQSYKFSSIFFSRSV